MTESQKHRDQNMQRSPTQLEIERERLEAIKQIEEEINLQRHVRNYTSALNALDFYAIDRTLSRLEAWRDEMTRGMR